MKLLDAPFVGDEPICFDKKTFPFLPTWDGTERYFYAERDDTPETDFIELIYNLNPHGFVVEGLRGKNLDWITGVLSWLSGNYVLFRTDRKGLVKYINRHAVCIDYHKSEIWAARKEVGYGREKIVLQ